MIHIQSTSTHTRTSPNAVGSPSSTSYSEYRCAIGDACGAISHLNLTSAGTQSLGNGPEWPRGLDRVTRAQNSGQPGVPPRLMYVARRVHVRHSVDRWRHRERERWSIWCRLADMGSIFVAIAGPVTQSVRSVGYPRRK